MGVWLPLGEGHGRVEEEGDGGWAFGDDVEKETWVDHYCSWLLADGVDGMKTQPEIEMGAYSNRYLVQGVRSDDCLGNPVQLQGEIEPLVL